MLFHFINRAQLEHLKAIFAEVDADESERQNRLVWRTPAWLETLEETL